MRILCFGDSNTWGFDPRNYFGGQYAAPWPELLAQLSGHTVINAGLNGREIPRQSHIPSPRDLLLVMLGTNDLLQGTCAADAAARMGCFLIGLSGQVTLVSPPPLARGAWVDGDELVKESMALAGAYRALAGDLGIPFIDTAGWKIPLAFDGVHFTEEGHRIFAEKLWAALKIFLDSHPAS